MFVFIVPDNETDTEAGMPNLLLQFKEWIEERLDIELGDLEDLQIFRCFAEGGTDLKLDLSKSPDENMVGFGDNLVVQSAAYEAKVAEERAAAETIEDSPAAEESDADFQDDDKSAKGGKKTKLAPGRLASLHGPVKPKLPTPRIPKKAGPLKKAGPPPLPDQNELPVSKAGGRRGSAGGPPPRKQLADAGGADDPAWLDEQAEEIKARETEEKACHKRSKRKTISSDEEEEEDDDDFQAEKVKKKEEKKSMYGKKPRHAETAEEGAGGAAAAGKSANGGFMHTKGSAHNKMMSADNEAESDDGRWAGLPEECAEEEEEEELPAFPVVTEQYGAARGAGRPAARPAPARSDRERRNALLRQTQAKPGTRR